MKLHKNLASIVFPKLNVGRIERNPRPNNHKIKKVLLEIYHSGNEKFAETAGMQCMSNPFLLFLFEYLKSY